MTGDFIPGSSSIGILLVVYPADDESNNTMIKYHFVHRSNIYRTITMTNLPSGQYKVSVFVMEGNGLPFNRSATIPRNVSINERKLYILLLLQVCLMSQSWDNVTEHYYITACYLTIECQLVQRACADEDHTPHCRPRVADQTHRVMATFSLRSNVESTTRP